MPVHPATDTMAGWVDMPVSAGRMLVRKVKPKDEKGLARTSGEG